MTVQKPHMTRSNIPPKKARYVKILPSRGYGDGLFQIIGETEREYILKGPEGMFEMYKVHCIPARRCD